MARSDLTVDLDGPADPARTVEYTAAMCGETLAGTAWLAGHDAECEDFCSRVAVVCLSPLDRVLVTG
ncbi:hypothetical protein GCM10010168_15400 [Actinoplanes ianthinogenes]|uniref:Uncharacterized protein n=1 Tax=Actinoplanes ianthinogenes TaxID=122358 RepID=A0ABM7LZE7_9ACTN|nr:hypothetical protein [Actinoplanes ianthinogenes]BCJ44727.1 hypothetical protein Aiant_53840 [Actinoplanes ianthinogenes]GGQ99605.1 hypothetical protein GCM10010168_15400 [Actinoplanes ianthinogenes]